MANWQETFSELKSQYVQRSTDRLAQIIELVTKLISNPMNKDLVQQLSRHFHWLAGSGSMYGFQKVSAMGLEGERLCDQIVSQPGAAAPQDLEKLKALLQELSVQFTGPEESGDTTVNLSKARAVVNSGKQEVLVIDEDQKDLESLRKQVEESGFAFRSARSFATTIAELEKRMPEGLILEIPLPDGDAYELVERVRSMPGGDEMAIIIVSKQTGFLDKVRSIHCGADAHFEKPVDMKAMFRRLRYLLDKRYQETPRILSVEDDPDQAAFIRAFLESAGYQVRTCTDPKNFESYMSAFQPDLVLLDVMLPGMTGYELARYIRQDERHATLPVLFLTTQGQIDARIESARSGGDDHLVKPVPPALLLSSVSSRLERARFLKTLLRRDGLTSLLNHTSFMEQAQTVIAQRRRHAGYTALILLDIDYFRSINERHGYPGGDKVLVALSLLLRRRLRQSDIIGRYAGDELGIIADGLDEAEALHLAGRLLADFAAIQHSTLSHSGFYATCSAGISILDAKNMTVESWLGSGYKALQQAKNAGRNCAIAYHEEAVSR
ncbi:MAG: response regulator [Candidatus Obscuribacter sp.]|nr:response regulator [Candidatus Obscuribacter sp.]MBK9278186.1 response regulator [Candidatus Obscuribacter sp.]MBL8081200.1 response regulator [Candidatus Obscuribacter sp.]